VHGWRPFRAPSLLAPLRFLYLVPCACCCCVAAVAAAAAVHLQDSGNNNTTHDQRPRGSSIHKNRSWRTTSPNGLTRRVVMKMVVSKTSTTTGRRRLRRRCPEANHVSLANLAGSLGLSVSGPDLSKSMYQPNNLTSINRSMGAVRRLSELLS
jgi:hypothetical protein